MPQEDEGAWKGEEDWGDEDAEGEEAWVPEVAAAASWFPTLSRYAYATGYCHSAAAVYTSSSLSTRGTSSPYKAYSTATIYTSDEVYVYSINDTYALVSYPTSSGRKEGYIKTSALLSGDYRSKGPAAKIKAKVYRNAYEAIFPYGNSYGDMSYGTIDKGDTVIGVGRGTTSYVWLGIRFYEKYVQVFYAARSGNRAWKIGYLPEYVYNSLTGLP